MRRFAAMFWLLLLIVISAQPVRATEQITSYRSDISVARDGTVTVTETIRANAEGQAIRRGIYRDIPLTLDAGGSVINVDFNLLSVRRDGRDEPYHTENIDNGVRVYIGDADTLLEHGEHTFEITYETNRQIRFLETHDELYWNAIGNQWAFPVLEGSATVTVPTGVDIEATAFFTGFQGATGKDARVASGGGVAVFNLTRRLEAGEGLTIAVKMPRGSIDRPTAAEERIWWLKDNLGLLLAGGGLLLVFGYYSLAWRRAGRDPQKGVLVPRWDAPEGISPALVNYIDNRGFSDGGWTALSAAALNLAVKGHVVLEDLKSSLVIRATDAAAAGLPTGESRLLRSVQSNGGALTVDKEHGAKVRTAGSDFRSAMEKEHRGKYYLANRAYIVLGVVLSVAVLIAIFAFGSIEEDTAALIIVPVFISFVLGTSVIGIGRTIFLSRSLISRMAAVVMLAFFSFVALTVLGGFLLFAYQSTDTIRQMPLLAAVGAIVLVNAIFFFLMGAPTPTGRRMMDGIDGLRQYLTLAEKDRMNMAGAPEMSPEHFETLLPYAVALGVEKPWSRAFEAWLAAAVAAGAAAAYTPTWYAGDAFHSGSFSDRMGGFAGSMASTMSASLPAPPSSSSSGFSSGGGFSGGGGGGGGGGGW